MAERDYGKEYRDYHSKSYQKKRRAERNKSRRKMVKAGRAHKGDGMDVDHKNRNTADNSKGNLRMQSKKKNRGWNRGRKKK
jgi:hypothetical protein